MEWKADWGLRARMAITMLLLGLLYIVFIAALSLTDIGMSGIVVVMGLFMVGQFFFSDKLALRSMGAREVDRGSTPNSTGRSSASASRPTSPNPPSPWRTRRCPTPSPPGGPRRTRPSV
ncbi:heat shock protein HtpX [Halolamina pelagica]|uniref:Heat shock protein HtpX n=1 Tax=Halolamina pelagica TaxID=699431 RepID=A0A0P7GYC7_9EURY|nr:heat shock protein HtpX [Halolamina pelagica]